MKTAVLDPAAIPSVEDHKQVRRHTQQLTELQEKLGAAQARRVELVAEQLRLRTAQHEHDVAVALDDGAGVVADPDRAPRLLQLDAEISRAATEATTLIDALERLRVTAADGRAEVQRDIDRQIAGAAQATVARMVPLVEQVLALNQQLLLLKARMPFGGLPFPVPPPQLLQMWLDASRG